MSEYLTSLGENEEVVMEELDNVCAHFAEELGIKSDDVKRCAALVWSHRREKAIKDWDDFLSANDMGPYGGR